MSEPAPLVAGIELGGTKGVALMSRGRRILRQARIATTTPTETLGALSERLEAWQATLGRAEALGIASFGPLGLDARRSDHGFITRTTKPGWSNVPVLGHFRRHFDGPMAIDTDVAGAALAEHRWGAGIGAGVIVYLTIGTGIGGGLVVDGKAVHGRVHPEMGHLKIRRMAGDSFPGVCPFHGDCLEGVASGPAIAARAGAPAETLPPDHWVWPLVAGEIAELIVSLILMVSPDRILIGGGVGMGKPFLTQMVRDRAVERMGGYVAGLTPTAMKRLVRPPALGDSAGPLGAIALGSGALQNAPRCGQS